MGVWSIAGASAPEGLVAAMAVVSMLMVSFRWDLSTSLEAADAWSQVSVVIDSGDTEPSRT